MQYTKDDTIFVQIASYRDPELQHTLQDLFTKAKRPENIFVGICHQYDMKSDADKHLFEVPFPRVEQLRINEVDYRQTKGMCWARNVVQHLYNNEKWSLRIDAHHRFKEHWDEELVLAAVNLRRDGRVIISQCPPSYNKETEEKDMGCSNRICCKEFISTHAIYLTQDYPKNPNLTIFNYGCFVFGLSEYVVKSLINPMLDNLDEVPFAITNWTKGVDFYSYHKPVIWHYWPSDEESKQNTVRKEYLTTKPFALSLQDDLLLIKKSNNSDVLKLNSEYGLGSNRSLRDYERFSGINLRQKKLREFTKEGIFEDWKEVVKKPVIQKYLGRTLSKIIKLSQKMATKKHITAIKNLFPQINSILEIQCGDGYDIENCEALQNKGLRYIGIDVRDEIIFDNRQYFRDEKQKIFMNLDASNEPLPTADLIVASGMAPYLPIANIWSLLENIRDSGGRFFAFDHYLDKKGLNSEINLDEENSQKSKPKSRPINLCQAPFYFPKPLYLVESDEEEKLIAIYEIADVRYFMDWHNDDVSKLRMQLFYRIKEDFDYLEKAFLKKSDGAEMFKNMMVAFLSFEATNHNKDYYYAEPYKSIIDGVNGLEVRNNIFRLIYRSETEIIMKEKGYEFINLENAIHVQVLVKDYIRWYFGLSIWIN